MASSCVPPKSCVMHNPDPFSNNDHSDTSSECGSLCSCTSSSMASIETIVSSNRVPDTPDQDNEHEALTGPLPDAQIIVTQGEEDESNRNFLLRGSPRITCCRKLKRLELRASLRQYLLISTELFPWIVGFTFIYYSYQWWGLASGFSSFFFMIGLHAIFRFVKTRGVLTCIPCSSHPQVEVESESSAGENDAEADVQQRTPEIPIDKSSEKPPSYDVAVVKPPPYDLKFHLTPKKLHTNPSNRSPHCPSAEQFTDPSQMSVEEGTQLNTFSESEHDSLPSYHDAMMLNPHSGNGSDTIEKESS